jgi:hypothetical protein
MRKYNEAAPPIKVINDAASRTYQYFFVLQVSGPIAGVGAATQQRPNFGLLVAAMAAQSPD